MSLAPELPNQTQIDAMNKAVEEHTELVARYSRVLSYFQTQVFAKREPATKGAIANE